MNKQEIIDALNAQGVSFDPAQSKADLAALLGSTAGKPGDDVGSTDTTGTPPAAADEKPDADKPAELPPVPDAPQAETLPFPSPFPKLIPDEHWNTSMQADFEAMLAQKISAGLSREQALEVIERQIDWDLKEDR